MNNNWKEQFKNWYITASGQNYIPYNLIADYIESNIIQSPEAARHHLSPVDADEVAELYTTEVIGDYSPELQQEYDDFYNHLMVFYERLKIQSVQIIEK